MDRCNVETSVSKLQANYLRLFQRMLHQPLQKQTKHTIFHFHSSAAQPTRCTYDKIRTRQSPWQNMVKPFRSIKILSNCVMNCELWYYILLWSSIMPTTYLKVTTLAPRHLSSPIIYYFLMSNNAFLCQKMFSLLKQKLSLWLPLHFQVSRDYSKAGGPRISWFLVPNSNHEMRGSWIPRTVFSVKPQNGSKKIWKSTFWAFFPLFK